MRVISSIIIMAGLMASHMAATAAPPANRDLAEIEAWLARPDAERTLDADALQRPLGKEVAAQVLDRLFTARKSALAQTRRDETAAHAIDFEGKTLRWEQRSFGTEPAGGHSLWISLHGGGNAPPELNDQQWRNQARLYAPAEGIYLAPRAPTNTWNLWHEAHIDPMLQRLIDDQVAVNGVDPSRVYLLGYSAGGDGVWQLAPRMADRFAAAATMAGHPNDASLLPLRNLPFGIFMGGADAAFDRNMVAARQTAEMARLSREDPGGYVHMSRIYEGLPHWMSRRDAEALPWMATFTRNAWPNRIVWVQDDVTADRFYWLQIPDAAAAKAGDRIVATVTGQQITLEGDIPTGLSLRLSDRLLDLDRPVRVSVNGRIAFEGMVARTAVAMQRSLEERLDRDAAAQALISLN